MAFPLPNVLYRIQSVDFDTCLELYYDIDNEAVILRNTKDTELQQWTFRKQKSGDAYQILAAATLASSTPRYFILPEVGDESQPRPLAPPKAVIRATTFNWNIFKESDGSYIITTKVGNMNHPGYLRVSEDGKPDSVEKQARGSKLADRSLRWRITEFDSVEPCSSLSRYPEIKEGDHAMRNLGTGHYWGFIAPSQHPHVTPVQTKEVKARFFYVDEGNTFKIGYLNSDWYILVDRVSLELVYGAENATLWVLERHRDTSGGYYYYICLASNTSKVVSGETVSGTGKASGGQKVFKLADKRLGSTTQQWKIEI